MQKESKQTEILVTRPAKNNIRKSAKLSNSIITYIAIALLSGVCMYLYKDYVLHNEKSQLLVKVLELENEIRVLKDSIDSKDREYSQQKANLNSHIAKLQSDIKALGNNDKNELNRRISELNIQNDELRQKINDLHNTVTNLKANAGDKLKDVLAPKAKEAVVAIKNKDMKKLSAMVHPEKGVRFSPYSYVNTKDHRVLTPMQVEKALDDKTKYIWGSFDGSGNPINMTFKEYLERFVYSKDYASTDKIGYNKFLSGGNMINNAFEVYTNAMIVEYYIPGTNPNYGGIDYGSLRLVFEEKGTDWYLVGIIHNQWTI